MIYTHALNRGRGGVRSPAHELGMSPLQMFPDEQRVTENLDKSLERQENRRNH